MSNNDLRRGMRKRRSSNGLKGTNVEEEQTANTETDTIQSAFHSRKSRDYVKKLTVEIDKDAHNDLKMLALRQGTTIRTIVSHLVDEYIREQK